MRFGLSALNPRIHLNTRGPLPYVDENNASDATVYVTEGTPFNFCAQPFIT